jgi:hypothetical protein
MPEAGALTPLYPTFPPRSETIAKSVPHFTAWRWAFFVPGAVYLIWGIISMVIGQVGPGALLLRHAL